MARVTAQRIRTLLRFALWFNVVGLVLAFAGPLLPPAFGLVVPWVPSGTFGWPLLALVAILTGAVAYWRSRVAAVLLLLSYVADRAFLFGWLYGGGLSLWLSISLVWALAFVPGVVGAFGQHRLPERRPRPRMPSLIVAGAMLVLAGAVAFNTWRVLTPLFAEHTVEFRATSSGRAHAAYASKSAQQGETDFATSWSTTITVRGEDESFLDVTSAETTPATVSCEILVDGKALDHRDQTAMDANVSCHADFA